MAIDHGQYEMIPETPNRYEPENGSLVATLTGWTVILILSPIWLPIVIYTLMNREKDYDGQE